MAKAKNHKMMSAEKQKVWNVLADMEGWVNWDPNASNKVIRHKIIEQYDNTVICDEIEQTAGFFKTHHVDKYTLHPMHKIEEVIVEGDLGGGFVMQLSDHPDGTFVTVDTDIYPKNFFLKIVDMLFGKYLLNKFWGDLLTQIELKANQQ